MLAVMLIIGILSAFLLVAVFDAEKSVEVTAARLKIATTQAALSSYHHALGDYPSSHFTADSGSLNELNLGAEAMVVALWSDGWEAGGLLHADELVNSDEDSSARQLTDFGTLQLLEVADPWGNPIAYFQPPGLRPMRSLRHAGGRFRAIADFRSHRAEERGRREVFGFRPLSITVGWPRRSLRYRGRHRKLPALASALAVLVVQADTGLDRGQDLREP